MHMNRCTYTTKYLTTAVAATYLKQSMNISNIRILQ